jgi:hypothetical protein
VIAQAGPWVAVFFHSLVETTEAGGMESIIGKDLSAGSSSTGRFTSAIRAAPGTSATESRGP